MDAKAQNDRPGPASGVENAIHGQQKLHNRHKSTSNFQTAIANTLGFKTASKRGALADLSNTNHGAAQSDAKTTIKGKESAAGGELKENVPSNININNNRAFASQQTAPAPLRTRALGTKNHGAKKSMAVHHDVEVQDKPASSLAQSSGGVPLQPRHHKSQPALNANDAASASLSAATERPHARNVNINTDLPKGYAPRPHDKRPDGMLHSDISQDNLTMGPARAPSPEAELVSPSENWTTFETAEESHFGYAGFPRAPERPMVREHELPMPRATQQTDRELLAAERLWSMTELSPEEIEDEYFDVNMVAEYAEEIFEYLKEMELCTLPRATYMEWQVELGWQTRSSLMEWLITQHLRLNLLPETLYLAVNFVDRFLSAKVISISRLQLVGATALLVAAKYEEINVPSLQEIEFITDGQYSLEDILKAERYMLNILEFHLGFPGPMSFLRRISKADNYDLGTRTLAKYFLEVTIMDNRFVGSPPSYLAAASQCLARLVLRAGGWTPGHVYLSGYTYPQLLPALEVLVEVCKRPTRHHHLVWSKHAHDRCHRSSEYAYHELQRFHLPASQPSPLDLLHRLNARSASRNVVDRLVTPSERETPAYYNPMEG